jgi:glutamyl/glutaminyl-tRNA synthetase
VTDRDGSVRFGGLTLLRPDGSATYQLASVVDDLELGITHVIRGSDHRPNEEQQRALARLLGGELPPVQHHGLLLGEDGRKLSKRHGHASVADFREEGIPAAALRVYLEELDLPEHDVHLDRGRIARLSIDAISALPDGELAAAAEAPVELARALRGARTLVEARVMARQILEEPAVDARPEDALTLVRFVELRAPLADMLDADEARALLRELKAVGGDLRALRRALTGAERGPELWAVVVALGRAETLRRAARARGSG